MDENTEDENIKNVEDENINKEINCVVNKETDTNDDDIDNYINNEINKENDNDSINKCSIDEELPTAYINVMEELQKEKMEKPTEISKHLEHIILDEVDDRLIQRLEDEERSKRKKFDLRKKSLSDAVATIKRERASLETSISNLIHNFEVSSGLTISRIDLVPNPRALDFGFKDVSRTERTESFGFSELPKERKNLIKVRMSLDSLP